MVSTRRPSVRPRWMFVCCGFLQQGHRALRSPVGPSGSGSDQRENLEDSVHRSRSVQWPQTPSPPSPRRTRGDSTLRANLSRIHCDSRQAGRSGVRSGFGDRAAQGRRATRSNRKHCRCGESFGSGSKRRSTRCDPQASPLDRLARHLRARSQAVRRIPRGRVDRYGTWHRPLPTAHRGLAQGPSSGQRSQCCTMVLGTDRNRIKEVRARAQGGLAQGRTAWCRNGRRRKPNSSGFAIDRYDA